MPDVGLPVAGLPVAGLPIAGLPDVRLPAFVFSYMKRFFDIFYLLLCPATMVSPSRRLGSPASREMISTRISDHSPSASPFFPTLNIPAYKAI
jgi:hypothetical protein